MAEGRASDAPDLFSPTQDASADKDSPKDVPSLIASSSVSSNLNSLASPPSHSPPPIPPLSSSGGSPRPFGKLSSAAAVLAVAVAPRIFTTWQCWCIACGVLFLVLSSSTDLTLRTRRLLQPLVLKKVVSGTKTVEAIQRYRNPLLDSIMSALAGTVSTEFYTAFIPLLFWSGREDVGLRVVMLLALGIYLGTSLKDVVCAPRPFSPPVVRVTRSSMEVQSSLEYGLPSTHTINIVCLSLYILHCLQEKSEIDSTLAPYLVATLFLVTVAVVFGRLYLGMHSPIDLAAGLIMGLIITAVWSTVDLAVVHYIQTGPNVFLFSLMACIFCLLAYPTPEDPTPSFEDHTCFSGVIFGMCATFSVRPGVEVTFLPLVVSSIKPLLVRLMVGLPLLIVTKGVGKEIAKLVWPRLLSALRIPLYSKKYINRLPEGIMKAEPWVSTPKHSGGGASSLADRDRHSRFDVDILIRLTQNAALGWGAKGLIPWIFMLARI